MKPGDRNRRVRTPMTSSPHRSSAGAPVITSQYQANDAFPTTQITYCFYIGFEVKKFCLCKSFKIHRNCHENIYQKHHSVVYFMKFFFES